MNKPSLVKHTDFFTGAPDNVGYEYDRMMRPTILGYPAWGSTSYTLNYTYDFTTKNLQSV